jgi:choline-sulfatase
LKNGGLEGETIVLFTADHGDMLGERGLWYKMTWHENASRVPLIVKLPGETGGRRVAQSVSTIDLLPTLAEIAGDGKAPGYGVPIDGRSLLPHLSGSGGHDEALGEYFGEGAIAPLLMIRRGRHKYIRSKPDPEQLYDLAADPLERVNRASDPAEAETLAAFRAEALARWDEEALRAQVIASQRRRHLVAASMTKGQHTSWDYQPRRDASRSYMRNHLELDDLEYRSRLPHVEAPAPKRN